MIFVWSHDPPLSFCVDRKYPNQNNFTMIHRCHHHCNHNQHCNLCHHHYWLAIITVLARCFLCSHCCCSVSVIVVAIVTVVIYIINVIYINIVIVELAIITVLAWCFLRSNCSLRSSALAPCAKALLRLGISQNSLAALFWHRFDSLRQFLGILLKHLNVVR